MEQLSHRFQSWIDESTSPHVHGEGLFFLWLSVVAWPVTRQSAGDQMDLRRRWGGQRMYVVPSRDLVVVVMAGLYDNPNLQPMVGEVILRRYALPAALAA